MASSYVVVSLIEKMGSVDQDFRYMALNDLTSELQKDTFQMDEASERKLVAQVIRNLDDKNSEVQNLVVRCLPFLVKRVREAQLEEIIEKLCKFLVTNKEKMRDVASVGLKAIIAEIAPGSPVALNICKRLTPRLIESLKAGVYEVTMDALDLLGDVLYRFGAHMVALSQAVLDALLPQVSHPRPAARKRTSVALGYLVRILSDKQYEQLLGWLVTTMHAASKNEDLRSYVTCLGAISRFSGKRMGKFLPDLTPQLLALTKQQDDELRETCLQTLESAIVRCLTELGPFMDKIVDISLDLVKHDPNYVEDDEDGDDGDEGEEKMETDEDQEGDDGDYSDDDDLSWKVRRASCKVLSSIITTRSDLLPLFFQKVVPRVVARFKEREENVRIDVMTVVADTLHITATTLKLSAAAADAAQAMETSTDGRVQTMLKELVPALSRALAKQLTSKSLRTRQASFAILRELVAAAPAGVLSSELARLAPGILAALTDRASNAALKIEALAFLRALLRSQTGAGFTSQMAQFVKPVLAATSDSYYKIVSEALAVAIELVRTMRPVGTGEVAPADPAIKPHLQAIYDATLARLKAQDVDQEVKERAISAMGVILAHAGDVLSSQLPTCLPVLLDKLRNEVTRLAAVKTLTFVARSRLVVPLQPILNDAVDELAKFLRKNNRAFKLASLQALTAILSVPQYCQQLAPDRFASIVNESRQLVTDTDLQLLPLSLAAVIKVLEVHSAALAAVKETVVPPALELVASPLLQGASLHALLDLLAAVVKIDTGLFDTLIERLQQIPRASENIASAKHTYMSLSQAIATLCAAVPAAKSRATVDGFVASIKTDTVAESSRYLALLTLGEIGRRMDLSGHAQLHATVLSLFSSVSEDMKSAAAFAIGNMSVGNLGKYLPLIVNEIKQQPKRQYLLLSALKEIISQEAQRDEGRQLAPFADEIWGLLFNNCESEEDGTRNIVADCLGRLTLINAAKFLPELQSRLASPSPFVRATVVTAIKVTFNDTRNSYDSLLRSAIGQFLSLVRDGDLNVRRASLQALNSAAQHKTHLLRDLLSSLLPPIYDETAVKKELIRIVTMGPFTHEVDDGLEIRKAAFDCLYAILETSLDRVDLFTFMDKVIMGLQDKFEIKLLCHQMVIRLCAVASTAVAQRLDELVQPLEGAITQKLKSTAVKQEIEKNDEMVRSSLRVVLTLAKLPEEATSSVRFTSFMNALKNDADIRTKMDAIARDEVKDFGLDAMDAS